MIAAWASYRERVFIVTGLALSVAWALVSIITLHLLGYVV